MNNLKRNSVLYLAFLSLFSLLLLKNSENVLAENDMQIVEKSDTKDIYKIKVSDGNKEVEYEVAKEIYENYHVGDNYSNSISDSDKNASDKVEFVEEKKRESKVFLEEEFKVKDENEFDNEPDGGDIFLEIMLTIFLAFTSTALVFFLIRFR